LLGVVFATRGPIYSGLWFGTAGERPCSPEHREHEITKGYKRE